ncbi:hypothetical protein KBC04_01120 [Candidatus Babeliales bacterium]|nr:hypothetical protein [Candidatus Babeliales bacterium]MBP9843667.1 hypothetical protein [Candidatus Babeliales bacterium]
MNKKLIIAFITCFLLSRLFISQKSPEQPATDFYSIDFLRNSPAVEKALKDRGFFEVNFQTHDNLMINAIMLDQSQDRDVCATIISCPGFVPGRKEGMSTLYAMLQDQPYNFIFIDSRGHGKSDGQLLTYQGIKHYGESQYLDVVGAIEYITTYNKEHNISSNIIIHGLCSGAYHTIKAVGDLKNSKPEMYHNIKGIVLDSAWPSINDIIKTVVQAESTERCKNYHTPFLQPYLAYALQKFYDICFKATHKKQRPITEIIDTIDQPILFIHAENDNYVPVETIYPLIETSKNPTSWIVKDSLHVNNHLLHKEKYKDQLQSFIQSVNV